MKKHWNLVDDLEALFGEDNIVYIYQASEKKKVTNVARDLYKHNCPLTAIALDNQSSKFCLKIINGALSVKSQSFPDPNNYYEVGNFDKGFLPRLLEGPNLVSGEFVNETFEVIFDRDQPKYCMFVSKKMPTWKEVIEEEKRKFYISCNRKTNKFIPGHRYDTADISFIYLGEFLMHADVFASPNSSTFADVPTSGKVQLFTPDINTTYKTISEVLSNKRIIISTSDTSHYGHVISEKEEDGCVFVTNQKLASMIDSGEVLTDDLSTINNDALIEAMVDHYMKKNERQDYPEYNSEKYFDNINELYSIFNFNSQTIVSNSGIAKKLEKIITDNLIHLTQIVKTDISTNNSNSIKTLSTRLKEIFMNNYAYGCGIYSPYVYGNKYVRELLNVYGLNLDKIATTVTSDFLTEVKSYNSSIDELIKHIPYYLETNEGCSRFDSGAFSIITVNNQLDNDLNYIFDKKSYADLRKVIEDIINNSTKESHPFCEEWKKEILGSIRTPVSEKISIVISIFNIIDYFGGKDKIPQEVEKQILKLAFVSLSIEIYNN